jgi:hypothetical protein
MVRPIMGMCKQGRLDRLRVKIGGLSDEEVGLELDICRSFRKRASARDDQCAKCGKRPLGQDDARRRFLSPANAKHPESGFQAQEKGDEACGSPRSEPLTEGTSYYL